MFVLDAFRLSHVYHCQFPTRNVTKFGKVPKFRFLYSDNIFLEGVQIVKSYNLLSIHSIFNFWTNIFKSPELTFKKNFTN
jgi:hypothetical protein